MLAKMKSIDSCTDESFLSRLRKACQHSSMQIVAGMLWLVMQAAFLTTIDEEVLGIVGVRLELLRQTVTFLKPAFRCNHFYLKYGQSNAVKLLCLWLLTVSFLAFNCCFIWLGIWNWLELPSEKYLNDYSLAVKIIGMSCIVEAFCEPAYLLSKTLLYDSVPNFKIYVEKAPKYVRVITMIVTVNFFPEYTIKAAAYAELCISIVVVVVHWAYCLYEFVKQDEVLKKKDLGHPKPNGNSHFTSCISDFSHRNTDELKKEGLSCNKQKKIHKFSDHVARILRRFSEQLYLDGEITEFVLDVLKQRADWLVFTYGEKYMMTFFPSLSLAEQGIYCIVSNLGERLNCCIFSAIEKQSFSYFARKLKRPREKNSRGTKEISDCLHNFLRIIVVMGCCVLIFGLSYSHPLSKIYAGNLLIEWPGSWLMKMQFLLIFLKAIASGTGSYAALRSNVVTNCYCDMGFRSLTYITLLICGGLSYFVGSIGLVVGNLIKFGLILLHNVHVILDDFKDIPENPMLGLLPHKLEAFALCIAFAATSWSEWFIYPFSSKQHLVIGGLSAAFVVESIVIAEFKGWDHVNTFLLSTFMR